MEPLRGLFYTAEARAPHDPAAVINHSIIENCTFYDIEREAIKGSGPIPLIFNVCSDIKCDCGTLWM